MFNTKLALVVAALAMTLAPVGFAQAEKTCTGSCSSCTTSTGRGVVLKAKLPPTATAPCCPEEAPGTKPCTGAGCEKTATVRVRLVDPQKAPGGCGSCQKKAAAAPKKSPTGKGTFVVVTQAAPKAARKATSSCSGDCNECDESCTTVESIALDDVTNDPATITVVGSVEQEAPGCKDCESKGKKPARMAGRVIDMQGADLGECIIVRMAPQKGGAAKARQLLIAGPDIGVDGEAIEIIDEIEESEAEDLLDVFIDRPHAVDMTTGAPGTHTFAWIQEEGCPQCRTCPKCKKCTACEKCKRASGPHAMLLRKVIDAHHPGMQGLPPMIMEHLGDLHAAHAAPGDGPDIQVFVDGKLVYSSKPHKTHPRPARVTRRTRTASPGHVDALLRRVDSAETSKKRAEAILLKLHDKEKAAQGEQKKETRIRWAVPDTQKKAAEVRRKAAEVRKQTADARKKAAAAKKKEAAEKKAIQVRRKTTERKSDAAPTPRRAAGVILGGPKSATAKSEMEQLRKDIDELRASLRKLTQEVRRLNRDR